LFVVVLFVVVLFVVVLFVVVLFVVVALATYWRIYTQDGNKLFEKQAPTGRD